MRFVFAAFFAVSLLQLPIAPASAQLKDADREKMIADMRKEIAELRARIEQWVDAADVELREPLRWQLSAGSKLFRPLTVFACCRAVSGTAVPPQVMRSAVALELFHNVTLIVDDHHALLRGDLNATAWTTRDTGLGLPLSDWRDEVRPEFVREFFNADGDFKDGNWNSSGVKALLAGRDVLKPRKPRPARR